MTPAWGTQSPLLGRIPVHSSTLPNTESKELSWLGGAAGAPERPATSNQTQAASRRDRDWIAILSRLPSGAILHLPQAETLIAFFSRNEWCILMKA
jgi:hypothetical protein